MITNPAHKIEILFSLRTWPDVGRSLLLCFCYLFNNKCKELKSVVTCLNFDFWVDFWKSVMAHFLEIWPKKCKWIFSICTVIFFLTKQAFILTTHIMLPRKIECYIWRLCTWWKCVESIWCYLVGFTVHESNASLSTISTLWLPSHANWTLTPALYIQCE